MTQSNPATETTTYRLHAEPHPAALARVLEFFVINDLVPRRVESVLERNGLAMIVTIEIDDLCVELARRLASRMAALVAVSSVDIEWAPPVRRNQSIRC